MRSLHIFSLCSSVLFSFFLPHSNRLCYEIYYCFRGFVHCVWLQTQIELLETSILTFSKSYLSVNCKLKYAVFNIRLGFHDLRVLEVLFTVLPCFWMCEVHSLVLAEWELFYMKTRNHTLVSWGRVYCRWLRKKIRVTGLF